MLEIMTFGLPWKTLKNPAVPYPKMLSVTWHNNTAINRKKCLLRAFPPKLTPFNMFLYSRLPYLLHLYKFEITSAVYEDQNALSSFIHLLFMFSTSLFIYLLCCLPEVVFGRQQIIHFVDICSKCVMNN